MADLESWWCLRLTRGDTGVPNRVYMSLCRVRCCCIAAAAVGLYYVPVLSNFRGE